MNFKNSLDGSIFSNHDNEHTHLEKLARSKFTLLFARSLENDYEMNLIVCKIRKDFNGIKNCIHDRSLFRK